MEALLKSRLPTTLDSDVRSYITSVCSTADDAEELSSVLGPLLSEHKWDDAKVNQLCAELMAIKKPAKATNVLLAAPVNLKAAAPVVTESPKESRRAGPDEEKLKALENRRERRKDKRDGAGGKGASLAPAAMVQRKENAQGKTRDVRVDNFDIAAAGVRLIENASLQLLYGRRYGFVGRNGSGKSTMLRAISSREISIPPHISLLHVEQEVEGDDTAALASVLAADAEREELLAEEKALVAGAKTLDSDTRLQAVYARLTAIEADKAEPRAASILAGLGFTAAMQKMPTKTFSGGWRMRLALARALFCEPDLLLLDEPTNMLDVQTVIWLEGYLRRWPSTLLVVSHDRDFLNSIATDIIHLWNKKLTYYRGDYDTFEKTRNERLRNIAASAAAQAAQRQHVQAFVDRFRYNAKRASLVQSRLKLLARMEPVPDIIEDPSIVFSFPPCEPLSPPIVQFNDVGFKYPDGSEIFKKLNFGLDLESRVAVVGPNGQGKSTLLKLLTGQLVPTSGYVHRHQRLRIGIFSQHHVDSLDLSQSALEFYRSSFPGKEDTVYRSHLGRYGVSGDLALQSMRTLSGGQKSRVAFSLMGWKEPHMMVLDEPTNHLDIETVEVLAQALNSFPGGVVLVTHDERLITLVCDELWLCGNQTVTVWPADFAAYRAQLEAAQASIKI